MKFSILVVTHNHSNTIENLLRSLQKFELLKFSFFCDANSSDSTLLIIKSYTQNILIKNRLEGFAKNNNDLIRSFNLKSDYYILLNPDTELIENVFVRISDFLDNNISYLIGVPKLIYPNGEIQKSWKRLPSIKQFLLKRLGFISIQNERLIGEDDIQWALGACLVISKKLLKNNHCLLDERFRLYCEDIDICFETIHSGYKIKAFSDLKVIHNLQERSSQNLISIYNFWNIQSAVKFILKWNLKYFLVKNK